MDKDDYIRQLKILIKKYHPDRCTDANLMQIYTEITKILNSQLDNLRLSIKKSPCDIFNEINSEKDTITDYSYYKSGIEYYKKVHSDNFYRKQSKTGYKKKTYQEQVDILNNIYISFSAAEYYFNKLISEYPDSPWVFDAKEKVVLLEKLYKKYIVFSIDEEEKFSDYTQFMNKNGISLL